MAVVEQNFFGITRYCLCSCYCYTGEVERERELNVECHKSEPKLDCKPSDFDCVLMVN